MLRLRMELDQFSHLVGKRTKQLSEEGAMGSIAPNWHLSLGTTQYYTLTEEPNFNIQSQWKKDKKHPLDSWEKRDIISSSLELDLLECFWIKTMLYKTKSSYCRGWTVVWEMGRTKQDLNFNIVFFFKWFLRDQYELTDYILGKFPPPFLEHKSGTNICRL